MGKSCDCLTDQQKRVLELIHRADRAGSALTAKMLQERLGYSSRGAVQNIVLELAERGKIERKGFPFTLHVPKVPA